MTFIAPNLISTLAFLLLCLFIVGSFVWAGYYTRQNRLPLKAIFIFLGFRFPLELILHSWVQQGSIPETMTWTGQNWDILSGILFLATAAWADKNRKLAWIVNLIGIALLSNVIRVAIMSSPLPFSWHVDPPLQLAFHFPYALIVPLCIGGAIIGQIVLTKRLLS